MAGKGAGCLAEAMSALRVSAARPVTQRTFARSMATEASSSSPTTATGTTISRSATSQTIMAAYNPVMNVPLTIHAFPSLEPVALEHWSVEHLYLPLRRDILQHAVVYEGDNTRQGTASTKNRYEVHGSHRKMRPQKGSGKSRMGTRQSPLLRGGGKTFGPRPRDFGTRLNRKEYDKAWRTALSYRYRRGELLVCEDGMDLPLPEDFLNVPAKFLKDGLREAYVARYMKGVLDSLGLGRPDGRTLFVTGDRRETLYGAMEEISEEGRALEYDDVDVKDLLEEGKVVMERAVLKEMIEAHQSDLVANIVVNGFAHSGPPVGKEVLGM